MFVVKFTDRDLDTAQTCCQRLINSAQPLAYYQRQHVTAVVTLLQNATGPISQITLDADQMRALRAAVFTQRDTTDLHFAASVQRIAAQLPDPLQLPWWPAPHQQVLQFVAIGFSHVHGPSGAHPTFCIDMPDRATFETALLDRVRCGEAFDGRAAAEALGPLWDDVSTVSVGRSTGSRSGPFIIIRLPQTAQQRNAGDNLHAQRLPTAELQHLHDRIRAAADACGALFTSVHVNDPDDRSAQPAQRPFTVELGWMP